MTLEEVRERSSQLLLRIGLFLWGQYWLLQHEIVLNPVLVLEHPDLCDATSLRLGALLVRTRREEIRCYRISRFETQIRSNY